MVQSLTIAIIGGGFSGTMVATQLLRWADRPLQIKLVEKREKFGQGVAYSTSIKSHVLNVPAAKMSAFSDIPEHFLNWIQHHYPEKAFTASSFVSRQYYGEYLQSILQEAQKNADKDIQIEYMRDEAIAVQPSAVGNAFNREDNPVSVTCRSGEQIQADCIVPGLFHSKNSQKMLKSKSTHSFGLSHISKASISI